MNGRSNPTGRAMTGMILKSCDQIRLSLVVVWLFAVFFYGTAAAQDRLVEREVTFKAEDGWVISGMLSVPTGDRRSPAVIFLHSYEHDRDAYGQYLYPGLAQIIGARDVATLRLDFRGRGKSEGAKKLHLFRPEERSKLYLDVRAAVAYLSSQPGIDPNRIGIVAEGVSAEAAVLGWSGDRRIKGMILISGRLSPAAKKQIEEDPELPLSLIVSQEDRESFEDMSEAYVLTRSDNSRIAVYRDIGMGTTMFSVWRSEKPREKPLEDGLADWMTGILKSYGHTREVAFDTEDGWKLSGTLRTPSDPGEGSKTAGVILIHSSFSSRHIFDHLAELLVRRGLVVLNFDTRGRGRSAGKGEFINLPLEERNKGTLDVKAAVGFLRSQPGVANIGLLGTDRGANNALAVAASESGIGALVLMTTLLSASEKEAIAKLETPVFYVASREIESATQGFAEAHASTKNRASRLLIFNGGALGYEIFELDESLEPSIADWLRDQLKK